MISPQEIMAGGWRGGQLLDPVTYLLGALQLRFANLDEETRRFYENEVSVGLWKNKAGEGEKAEVNLTIDPSGRLLEPGVTWEQMSLHE